MNKLDQLKQMSDVVADTGDIAAVEKYRPVDATTNPSLLLHAAQSQKYDDLIAKAVTEAIATTKTNADAVRSAAERFAVAIGVEILNIVPGRVSTEVDARLSFDMSGSVESARRLVQLYEEQEIGTDRLLIKAAATWEGIRACEVLEGEGINCNLTLLFSEVQAVAAAQAGAFLISPFVGRILDWHKKTEGGTDYAPDDDPGVRSVRRIHARFKERGYATIVMGASFRNLGEIEALAGCDRLTIAPRFLEQLSADDGNLLRSIESGEPGPSFNGDFNSEAEFRFRMNSDAMATEKLAEGIRDFVADQIFLEDMLMQRIRQRSA